MLLQVEAEKLTLNDLQKGVMTEIVTKSGLFALMPVTPINGKAYQYTREKALGSASWVGPGGHVKEATATYDTVTTTLKAIIGDADVPDMLEEQDGNLQSPMALQIQAKTKVIMREMERILLLGNSTTNPDEPDGFKSLCTNGQTIYASNDAADGGVFGFKDLDRLKALVKVGDPAFWLDNQTAEIMLRELYRAVHITPMELALPNFDANKKFLYYAGLPFIINDWQQFDETRGIKNDCASIYCVGTSETEGFSGLISRSGGGIRVKMIGTLSDKDVERVRCKMYFGTALRSTLCLSRLGGVRNL